MVGWSVVLFAVGAAAAYAVAATLKHASAAHAPDVDVTTGRSVARFVRATVTHRLWLASIVVDVVGVCLQVLALRRGALAVVQPLLVSGLVVALLLRALTLRRVTRSELAWGAVLAAALAGFLAVADVSSGAGAGFDRTSAVVVGVGGAAVAVFCAVVAHRRRGRVGAAAMLGVTVGLLDATTATMLKALTVVAGHGVLALVTSWQLYALLGCGAAAMVMTQLAFKAGPMSGSLPVISSVDPLASVVVGVLVLDETVRRGSLTVVALAALLGVLVIAVVKLSRMAGFTPVAVAS